MLICCILSVVFGMFLHSRLFSALNLLCLAILKLDNGRIDYFLHWNQPLKYMTREQTLFLVIVHTTTFTTNYTWKFVLVITLFLTQFRDLHSLHAKYLSSCFLLSSWDSRFIWMKGRKWQKYLLHKWQNAKI